MHVDSSNNFLPLVHIHLRICHTHNPPPNEHHANLQEKDEAAQTVSGYIFCASITD